MTKHSRSCVLAVWLGLGTSLSAPAFAQEYTVTRLDPSSSNTNTFSSGTSINDKGVVLGSGSGQFTTDLITIWAPKQTVGTNTYYFGYNRTSPEGINDSGDVVGYGPNNSSEPHGFFNSTDLGRGYVNDVNNLGQVAGWTYDSLYIWQNGVFDFQPTGYWGSEILSINDSGVAVGYWFTDCTVDCYSEVCIFRGDSITLLGSVAPNSYAQGYDINNMGQIAGYYCTDVDCTEWRGFLWTEGVYTTIPTLGGFGSSGNALNDSGIVVGDSYVGPGVQHAIIFDEANGLRDLNTLIPPGSGWELISASDINNHGQITGIGKIGGLTRAFLLSPPDTSLELIKPELDELSISGRPDTIRWYAQNVDSVRLSVILHYYDTFGQTVHEIVNSFPAANEEYIWEVPDSLLSRQCRIVIEDISNANVADTGADFKIKGWQLTRIAGDGEYEAFTPTVHGWSVANTTFEMWPSAWFDQFDYSPGTDPYTQARYPEFFRSELRAEYWWFIDWPLFVKTFGVDSCYMSPAPTGQPSDYRPTATSYWAQETLEHKGSCAGLAVISAMAFGNKDIFLQHFPTFGVFDDLYAAPFNNARREVVNQLHFTQFSRAPQVNEDTVLRNPNEAWIQKLKNTFLDEDRSVDAFLGLYSSRGGGHAVTPYKLVQDSVPGIAGDLYLLYVYDNNYPGDSTRAFVIRPADGFWRYPVGGQAEFINYGAGLFLERFSLYLEPTAIPETVSPRNPGAPVAQSDDDYLQVRGFSRASVNIHEPNGDSIGYIDTVVFNTVLYAEPITPKTGYITPPSGYRLPQGDFDIKAWNIADSNFSFFFRTDYHVYNLFRRGVQPSDTDYFRVDNGLHAWNRDGSTKTYNLQAIVVEGAVEKVYAVAGLDFLPNDSMYIDAGSNAFLYLKNYGGEEFYDFTLRLATPSGGTEIAVKNVRCEANSGHLIWPDWTDLSQPIKIHVDLNNDGPVDDTIFVTGQPTAAGEPDGPVRPGSFELAQNYPNPFNASTAIRYVLQAPSHVSLEIFNPLGQKVRTLVWQEQQAGSHVGTWDGQDDAGRGVPSGLYLYRLRAGEAVQTRKMLLLK